MIPVFCSCALSHHLLLSYYVINVILCYKDKHDEIRMMFIFLVCVKIEHNQVHRNKVMQVVHTIYYYAVLDLTNSSGYFFL